jgi:hypothetical protein
LAAAPLQLHHEPRLLPLFTRALDGGHVDSFAELIDEYGFRPDPPELGSEPFAFVVHGDQGAGKTTLVNRLILHLQQCAPSNKSWKLYGQTRDVFASVGQGAILDRLRADIANEKPDYACIVLDDFVSGAEKAASDLFDSVVAGGTIVFLFIVTSDRALRNKKWAMMSLNPTIYEVQPIGPEQAVEHIARRLAHFRIAGFAEPDPLFPFVEADIHDALREQAFDAASGIVTLRTLNVTLCNALRARRKDVPAAADMRIDLATAYRDMLAA